LAQVINAQVLESTVIDESVLLRLLRRAGRIVALPALECLELLLDAATPPGSKNDGVGGPHLFADASGLDA
jgi:hypothetical protein